MGFMRPVIALAATMLFFGAFKAMIIAEGILCTENSGIDLGGCQNLPDIPEYKSVPFRELTFNPVLVNITNCDCGFLEETALGIYNIAQIFIEFGKVFATAMQNVFIGVFNAGLLLFFALQMSAFLSAVIIAPLPGAPWYVNLMIPGLFGLVTAAITFKIALSAIHGEG